MFFPFRVGWLYDREITGNINDKMLAFDLALVGRVFR